MNQQSIASSGPINVASTVSSIVTSTLSGGTAPVRRDYTDPLHLTIVPSMTTGGCGASPTRGVGRQCYSPALQQHVRNASFCPSPSPTKRTFSTRRSLSPIALRPSPLGAGLKRKWDMDDRCEPFLTPSKRASTCTPDRCVGGLLMTQAHRYWKEALLCIFNLFAIEKISCIHGDVNTKAMCSLLYAPKFTNALQLLACTG